MIFGLRPNQRSDIEIHDNFLSEIEFAPLVERFFIHKRFPWYLEDILTDNEKECDNLDNYQFVHHFYTPIHGTVPYISDDARSLDPILRRLDFTSLVRIKANLLSRTSSKIRHGFHVDHPQALGQGKELKVSIFYINTNNGYTEFEDGTKIESVANRLVTFPNHLKHSGTTCTDQYVRMLINFLYF